MVFWVKQKKQNTKTGLSFIEKRIFPTSQSSATLTLVKKKTTKKTKEKKRNKKKCK